MWPLSNITSAQNRRTTTTTTTSSSSSTTTSPPHIHIRQVPQNRIVNRVMTTNPLFCQMVSCVQQYDTRSQSPTIMKRNVHCFIDHSLSSPTSSSQPFDEVELVYSNRSKMRNQKSSKYSTTNNNINHSSSKKLKSEITISAPSSTSAKTSKSIIKKDSCNRGNIVATANLSPTKIPRSKKKKSVSFDLIEVREHPRILGDNPSAKKGPPLSIGWYEPADGRIFRYSVDEYERRRFGKYGDGSNNMKKKSVEIISPTERQRMLLQDVGVTASEIFAARKEVSKIRKSRRDHNILVNYDETAVVLEQCIHTVQRFLSYNGTSSENELRVLMEQVERSKEQQQLLLQRQQQQQRQQQPHPHEQPGLHPIRTIRSPSRIYRQHYQHLVQ